MDDYTFILDGNNSVFLILIISSSVNSPGCRIYVDILDLALSKIPVIVGMVINSQNMMYNFIRVTHWKF